MVGLCDEFIFSIGCPGWVMVLIVLWGLSLSVIFYPRRYISVIQLSLVSLIIFSFITQKVNQAVNDSLYPKKDPCLGY